jgi:excisionase family DNA binding protein
MRTTDKDTTGKDITETLAYTMNEAAALSRLSRRTLELYVAQKLLPSRKIGKRRLILRRDLENFLKRDQPSPTVVRGTGNNHANED